MKAVLISIQPKWCELITIKKKSLEVRKNRPKLETPFRCYIYETRKKWWYKLLAPLKSFTWVETVISGQGKVIGEFICDTIVPISVKYSDINSHLALREFPLTCLTDKQIIDYLGNALFAKLKKLTKKELLFVLERVCSRGHRSEVEYALQILEQKKEEEVCDMMDAINEKIKALQKERNRLLEPYALKKITEVPMEVLIEAATLNEQIEIEHNKFIKLI